MDDSKPLPTRKPGGANRQRHTQAGRRGRAEQDREPRDGATRDADAAGLTDGTDTMPEDGPETEAGGIGSATSEVRSERGLRIDRRALCH
jgi:hypothetical protein